MGDQETDNLTLIQRLHQKLFDFGVPHEFEVFSGGHSDKRVERIAEAMKFLSESLAPELPAFASAPRKTENGLVIQWNEAARGYRLQKTSTLIDPVWREVAVPDNQTRIELEMEDVQAFFRLISP